MEQHIITFKNETQVFTNIVNFDVTAEQLMTVFHSSLIAMGFTYETIVKGIAQYIEYRDFGYETTKTTIKIGEETNFIVSVNSKYSSISVEIPYDATIIDFVNAWYAILIQLTFGQKIIFNRFKEFVEDYEDTFSLEEELD